MRICASCLESRVHAVCVQSRDPPPRQRYALTARGAVIYIQETHIFSRLRYAKRTGRTRCISAASRRRVHVQTHPPRPIRAEPSLGARRRTRTGPGPSHTPCVRRRFRFISPGFDSFGGCAAGRAPLRLCAGRCMRVRCRRGGGTPLRWERGTYFHAPCFWSVLTRTCAVSTEADACVISCHPRRTAHSALSECLYLVELASE